MNALSPETITSLLASIPDWQYAAERGGLIRRRLAFKDFAQAFDFMTQMAAFSETIDHHPEWCNVYRHVDVTLTTHDCGGLSEKDFAWAKAADQCARRITGTT